MNKPVQELVGTPAPRKPLYIALIVIALIAILVLVYFGTKTFAGKATATAPEAVTILSVGQAGITDTSIGIGTLTIDIGANIGTAQSVAFDFVLNYPADALEYVGVTPAVTWGVNRDSFERKTPSAGQIAYDLATIDFASAITGDRTTPLARVTFNVRRTLTAADYQALTFSSFNVYNLNDDTNIITSRVGGSGGTEIQECRADAALCGPFCTATWTSAYCQSQYSLVPSAQCTTANDASCTAYYNTNPLERDTDLCGAWLDTLSGTSLRTELSSEQLTALCQQGVLSVDLLNNDGIVGNDELFIIKLALFAKDSEPQPNCGGLGEPLCYFRDQGYYICENLEFIQVVTGTEAPAAGQVCGGIEHITGVAR